MRTPLIAPGQALPELEIEITAETIVRYCEAAGDFSPQHWDPDHMRALGFEGIIAHGWLTFAHMVRVIEDWVPPELADIIAYEVRYKRTVYPGAARYGGSIVAERGAEVDLDLWAKNPAGDITATATLTIRLA